MSIKTKVKNLERLDKFLTEQKTTTVLKEKEYSIRRDKKIQRRKEIEQDRRLLYFKYLYIPSIVGIMSGTVLIFGSTIRTVSEGSFFWANRQTLQVLGPILLGLGIIFLLFSVGLVNWREKQMRKMRGYNIRNSLSRGTPVCNSIESMTVSRQSSVRSSYSGLSNSRECRYARLKTMKWKSPDLFENQFSVKCVTDAEFKQEKDAKQKQKNNEKQKQKNSEEQKQKNDEEQKQKNCEEQKQKNSEEQKQKNGEEQRHGEDAKEKQENYSEAKQETDVYSVNDVNITNEYITQVWIKRSDLCDVSDEQQTCGQNIGGINNNNFVKIDRPFNLSVQSGIKTKIGHANTIRKSSVKNKMSCQIYIE